MKKRNAFTFGEVLMTLSVIGVLFLVSIPILGNITPRSEISLTRKAYNLTETIVHEMINDSTLYPDVNTGFAYIEYTDDGGTPHYTISKEDTSERFCQYFLDYLNTMETTAYNSSTKVCNAVTPDGISWGIIPKFYNDSGNIETDIEKSTQISVAIPRGEIFTMFVRYDGKILVTDPEVIAILKDPNKLR